MKKMITLPESDRVDFMLDRLCREISKGRISCPKPDVLTAALRGLFPEEYFPPEMEIAINESSRSSWYTDRASVNSCPAYGSVLWLRRRLSSYIAI